jgi:hypothetical protein
VDLLSNGFIASSSTTGRNLVLSANALEPGWEYTLRFDVEAPNGAAAAFLSVQDNQAPAGRGLLTLVHFFSAQLEPFLT